MRERIPQRTESLDRASNLGQTDHLCIFLNIFDLSVEIYINLDVFF